MNKCCLVAFLLFLACSIKANSGPALFLIPQPKKIELRNGTFSFSTSYSLDAAAANSFYAAQLQDAIAVKFNGKPIANKSAVNHIELIKADSATLDKVIKAEKLAL